MKLWRSYSSFVFATPFPLLTQFLDACVQHFVFFSALFSNLSKPSCLLYKLISTSACERVLREQSHEEVDRNFSHSPFKSCSVLLLTSPLFLTSPLLLTSPLFRASQIIHYFTNYIITLLVCSMNPHTPVLKVLWPPFLWPLLQFFGKAFQFSAHVFFKCFFLSRLSFAYTIPLRWCIWKGCLLCNRLGKKQRFKGWIKL